jgi:glycosyltransferase involved in cell wall biosynthesis
VANKAKSFGFPEERITLFPWGVDLLQFFPGRELSLREKLGWQDNAVFLSLRSWEPIYGIDVLIEGFAKALNQNDNIRLLLLGSGSQKDWIETLIIENDLEPYIHRVGHVQNHELLQYYQAADVYLSSSFSDGSSVSLMEALACGLPVLVSDIPGNEEWITPDQQGWLFKTGMADSLADGILTALSHRDQWSEIGMNARWLAEKRADWLLNFQKLLVAYDRALETHTSKHGGSNYGLNG